MSIAAKEWDAGGHWAPFVPGDKAPWNLHRVVHLHRRAGFAATWKEIQRDLNDGPRRSVTRLLRGQARAEGAAEDFEEIARALVRDARDPSHLKASWFYRMYWSPDPLTERLTLLWHNHFATSNEKVQDLPAMRRQNDIFRRHARGPFGELLRPVLHDPAMLIWLDASANRQGKANENLGRELMELFTLGIGHYSEMDVKEAARALTGWTVARGAFKEDASLHDGGVKTILGRRGKWKGDDLVRLLLEHPATSRRLAWRLCDWLMGEGAVGGAALDALAAGLRAHDLDVAWAVETVLRSSAFFAEKNLATRPLGPVEYVVGVARALECFDPPPNSLVLAEWAARLGQDLFYPPNVGGWPGGRGWLSTRAIVGRANYAVALVEGRLWSRQAPLNGIAVVRRHRRGRSLDDFLSFYAELLTGASPEGWRKRLRAALGSMVSLDVGTAAAAVALTVASPETQLG